MSDEKKTVAALAVVGAITLAAPMVAYVTWAWAVVTRSTWGWYFHPMFPSLPEPSVTQFIALSMMVTVIRHDYNRSSDEKGTFFPKLVSGIVMPWLFWLIAWGLSFVWQPLPYVLP